MHPKLRYHGNDKFQNVYNQNMRNKLFILFLALVCAVGTANATWWPSEHYCTFCNNFKIDHAFQFSSAGGQDNGSKYSYGVDFQECQGVIAFSLLTWDRYVLAEANDYGMKWVEVYLTGGSNDLWIADIYFTDPKSGGYLL